MKKIVFFLIVLTLILIPIASSASFPSYYDKYVNDFGKMFSENETASLRILLHEVDLNTTAEVVVATIPDCGGDYDGYSVSLASNWKIGKADKDNGLLILYCQDVKRLVVKTGYGLEGILPDGKIGRYLDYYYVPLRDNNQTTAGIIAFTQEIAKVIYENREEVISGQAKPKTDYTLYIILVFLIFFLIGFLIIRKKIKKETKIKKGEKNKPTTFGKVIDVLFWINLFVIVAVGFQVILVVLFIALLILRIIFGPKQTSGGTGFWGFGGRGGGFSSGGFGGGGFGGGGFGGGGASR